MSWQVAVAILDHVADLLPSHETVAVLYDIGDPEPLRLTAVGEPFLARVVPGWTEHTLQRCEDIGHVRSFEREGVRFWYGSP